MLVINSKDISRLMDFGSLISELKLTFKKAEFIPPREVYNINKNHINSKSQFLIMPAFIKNNYYGVKLLNVFPNNPSKGLERIKALYVLFNKNNGEVKAIIDGTVLTKYRTAAMSALASKYLSNKNSKKLLIIGTGALVPYMISAHTFVRKIEEVFVWGRDYEKAKKIVTSYKNSNFKVIAIKALKDNCKEMDIISTVTSSNKPLLFSEWCKKGVHLDLVGAHTKNMIEVDAMSYKLGDIYVEDIEFALEEAGDLIKSLNLGYINRKNIKGNITSLIKKNKNVRKYKEKTTIFKSVGHPLSDLAAAILVYKKYKS